MKMSKIALLGITAAGMVFATTAQASTRSVSALPQATVKAKKAKLSLQSQPLARTAPSIDGASRLSAAGTGLLVVGLGLATWGFVEAVDGNSNSDSPGA